MTPTKACATLPCSAPSSDPLACLPFGQQVHDAIENLRLVLTAAKVDGAEGRLCDQQSHICDRAAARMMDTLECFALQQPSDEEVFTLWNALRPVYGEMLELKDRWLAAQRWHVDYETRLQRLMLDTSGYAQVYDVFEGTEAAARLVELEHIAVGSSARGPCLPQPLMSPPTSKSSSVGACYPPEAPLLTPPKAHCQPLAPQIYQPRTQVKFNWLLPYDKETKARTWCFSTLMTQFHRFTLTQTVRHGGSGKIRWAIDPHGEVFVAKEFRLGLKSGMVVPDKKTRTSSFAQIVSENERTAFFRSVLDIEAAPPPDRLSDRVTLNLFRAGTQPFRLLDTVVSHRTGKAYMVMTRETGDLFDLHGLARYQPEITAAAARSMATQIFVELQALHQKCHFAHFDISRGNVLYNRLGQFKLLDFEMAMALDDDMTSLGRGFRGSIAAPEMVAFNAPCEQWPYLTAAADVFALAALTVHLACPDPYQSNPFEIPDFTPDLGPAERAGYLWSQFSQFEAWKDALRPSPCAWVDVFRIPTASQSPFDAFFGPLAQKAPFLCDHLINRAMVADVTQRASAQEMATILLRNTMEVDTAATLDLVSKMAQTDNLSELNALSLEACKYDNWQAEHVASLLNQDAGLPLSA